MVRRCRLLVATCACSVCGLLLLLGRVRVSHRAHLSLPLRVTHPPYSLRPSAELNFVYGDSINVTATDTGDAEWYEGWAGVSGTRAGLFPSTFVAKPDDVERCE